MAPQPDLEAYVPLKIDLHAPKKSVCNRKTVLLVVGALLLSAVVLRTSPSPAIALVALASLGGFAVPPPSVPPVNVFEVLPPLAAPAGAIVSSVLLLNNTQLEDGLKVKYAAPKNFTYTGALVTLNVTVPALAPGESAVPATSVVEISVGDSPLWRFSTPNARADAPVFASTTKNVSDYLELFTEKSKVHFSVLEGSAVVNASLELTLYSDAVPSAAAVGVDALFSTTGPASDVFALQKAPVKVPGATFVAELPQVAANVTAARVSLFVSAADAEIEFYKKDIAALGEPVTTNGPARQLNVFVGGVYVATVSPKPTLFHADKLSPKGDRLWTPVADSGSFSGFTYDVDLVAVLPLLWELEQDLEIFVVSPVDAANKVPGVPAVPKLVTPGSNLVSGSWFISGNLLVWENSLVADSFGEIVLTNSSQLDSGVLVAPPAVTPWQPKLKTENLRSTIDSTIASFFNYTLVDGTFATFNVVANSSSAFVLSKTERNTTTPIGPPGSGAEIVSLGLSEFYLGASEFDLEVQDPLTNVTVYSKSIKAAYPLSVLSTIDSKPVGVSEKLSYKIGIDLKTKVNKIAGAGLKIDEKLAYDDLVGSSADIKFELSEGKTKVFSREVQVVNGTLTSDVTLHPVQIDEDVEALLREYF